MIEYLQPHALTFATDLFRLCVWLAILSVIFIPLERFFALTPRKIARKEIGADLCYYFINAFIPALILSLPLALLAAGVRRFIPLNLHETVAEAPFWARICAALIVAETGYYWGHRAMHEIPALWRFHAVHHSAEQIDFLVNTRAHPVDMVIGRLSGMIPLYVLGLAGPNGVAGSTMPVLITLAGTLWGFFIHANLRWRFGPLEWVVSTPAFHHWHHNLVTPTNRNYASTLPWLDLLFGTFHLPKTQWPPSYGIKETIPGKLMEQLIHPEVGTRPSRSAPNRPAAIASQN